MGKEHEFKARDFTPTQAKAFLEEWEVVDQESTTTGFSGTLFRNKNTRELVISFRSTEFIDDAARDNEATNSLEIFDTGYAWGQMRDMARWYLEIQQHGLLPANSNLTVTGYSLGGHLATAFNLMYPGTATQVITFNGAGVGQYDMESKSLLGLVEGFTKNRAADYSANISHDILRNAYVRMRDAIENGQLPGISVP